jgi:hypothetical protein
MSAFLQGSFSPKAVSSASLNNDQLRAARKDLTRDMLFISVQVRWQKKRKIYINCMNYISISCNEGEMKTYEQTNKQKTVRQDKGKRGGKKE